MPPLRGIGVVAQTDDKRQIEAVRAQLRSEAFWTRRRRRSLGLARASGEAPRGATHSASDDGAEDSGSDHTDSVLSGESTSASRAFSSYGEEHEDDAESSRAASAGTRERPGSSANEHEVEEAGPGPSGRIRLNSTQAQIEEIIKRGNERAKTDKRERLRSKRRGMPNRRAHFRSPHGTEGGESGRSQDDNSGQMSVLLQCRLLAPGNSALLLLPDTRNLLNIDVRGQKLQLEEGLVDFRKADWSGKRALIHQVMMEPSSSRLASFVSFFILLTIVISSTTFCLETVEDYEDVYALRLIEAISIVIFTLEYIIKIVTAPNLWRFIRSPLNIIDLVAILPWYIDLLTDSERSQGTSVLRIIRLARIFKLGGRYGKFQVVSKAMLVSLDVLGVLFFLIVITVVIFATLVYYTEYPPPNQGEFPMNPQAFTSIPESFWWAMVTVNTVGYGDVVPVTLWGKIVAGGLMMVGLLIMALPISVIGTNFTAEWMDYKDFLTQREAIKHLPPKVILFEELLSEHVHNVEEIISRYSETEAELDYLRMKMQDKIIQKKAEMEQKVDQQEIEALADGEVASSHSYRHLTFKNLFPKDKTKTRDRYSRELAEIKDLEQLILNKSAYLKDLLAATEFLRSDHFEEKVKSLRLKYKQLEFIKDESYVLRSAMDEVEQQVRKVEPNMDFSKPVARNSLSSFDPLVNISASAAWSKLKKYSRMTTAMSRKVIPLPADTQEGSAASSHQQNEDAGGRSFLQSVLGAPRTTSDGSPSISANLPSSRAVSLTSTILSPGAQAEQQQDSVPV